ncbi:MAG: hypothetical protein ACTMIR_11390 [Cellulomonadaceae bacterium]
MYVSRSIWSEYDLWNEAIAEVVFPELDSLVPVYLDLEDDEIEAVAARVGVPAESAVERLGAVVARTLDLTSNSNAFKTHFERVLHWRDHDRTDTFPVLATLAVFSLAAERMAKGSGMRPTNYYGRLTELLGGSPDRLGNSVRKYSEPMWAGLNLWLEALAGLRGLPSAYSIGQRFVGVPMSQALVREADRRHLERFFADFDLAPRSAIPAAELEPLLTSWFAREGQASHLGKLWKKESLQPRISEVASIELEAWNGVDESEGSSSATRGRVVLGLQSRTFPKRTIRLFPFFFLSDPGAARKVSLVTADDEMPVALEPAGELQGALALEDRGLVDSASLLEGVLQIRDDSTGDVSRLPRAMVVFRKDELSGLWLEARQVLLGDDVIVLASDRVASKVKEVLAEIARPGWSEVDARDGLPIGWTMFDCVEVFSRPSSEQLNQDFQALVPLTSSQLKVTGGLSLPGATRNRWHSKRPPEIRAVSDESGLSLHLIDLGLAADTADDQEIDRWDDGGTGSIIQSLEGLDLEDGHYAIEMRRGATILSRREFSLHSSAHPDPYQSARVPHIQHGLNDPLAVIGADALDATGTIVQGVVVEYLDPDDLSTTAPPTRAWWRPATDAVRGRTITLRKPEPNSCFFTGRHFIELPVAKGDNLRETVVGVCKFCGTQKRYSASYYKNRAQHARQQRRVSPSIGVLRLPNVGSDEGDAERWDVALDAVRYLRGGSISILEGVARQVDASRLFVSEFINTLESLGHIEVRRSRETLEPVEWQAAPAACVDTGTVRVLTGAWTSADVAAVGAAARQVGGKLLRRKFESGPSRIATTLTTDELAETLEVEALLPERAGQHLSELLPALSNVVAALPRVPAVSVTEVQVFDPQHAAWVQAFGMDAIGAYRAGRYSAAHYIRTADDIANGTLARASVYLAKHWAAAALAHKPLLTYSASQRELTVPLGALLPGMYQRAVMLDSGTPPQRVRSNHIYRETSPDIAARIAYLLEN